MQYRSQPFVKTQYFGPTNARGSRVKATHMTSNKSVTISWDHALNSEQNHLEAAAALWNKLGFPLTDKWIGCGLDGGGYLFTPDLNK